MNMVETVRVKDLTLSLILYLIDENGIVDHPMVADAIIRTGEQTLVQWRYIGDEDDPDETFWKIYKEDDTLESSEDHYMEQYEQDQYKEGNKILLAIDEEDREMAHSISCGIDHARHSYKDCPDNQ